MLTKDFYQIIDQELSEIIKKYSDDEMIKKHYKSEDNQKSYAFLIWFLEFYGKKTDYVHYITDGPGDNSCDIIFDAKDTRGKIIYYVIQSKWNNEKNAEKNIVGTDLGYAISDFTTMLRGNKQPTENDNFNNKLTELSEHIRNNGFVKFIFLALCQERIDDNVNSFNQEFGPHIKLKFIDINRIKHDYIEHKYKQIKPANPLEHTYKPEDILIELEVTRRKNNGDFVRIDKPFDAYIFLVKSSLIFNLFEEFSFSLFFKNVRNPIINSAINEQIEKTLSENPAYFWYYNNGITAIVDSLPKISKLANKFKVYGFQIINGAQTVYAIHSVYKNASPREREKMDNEIFITLRLLKSGGKNFDLQVTRYTNSQNPISDRDFHANDDVQIRLQQESFKTKFWYEKREGEFRGKIPKGIKIVPNKICAEAYLVYELQEGLNDDKRNLLFVSNKEHPNGLYEKIFNERTKFRDILCSIYLYSMCLKTLEEHEEKNREPLLSHCPMYLQYFKIIFVKYLEKTEPKRKNNPNQKIIELFEKEKFGILSNVFYFIGVHFYEFNTTVIKEKNETLLEYFTNMEINARDIDHIYVWYDKKYPPIFKPNQDSLDDLNLSDDYHPDDYLGLDDI